MIVGRKPVISLEQVRTVRASQARRAAEPTLAQWAAMLGVGKETLRNAVKGRQKHYRGA